MPSAQPSVVSNTDPPSAPGSVVTHSRSFADCTAPVTPATLNLTYELSVFDPARTRNVVDDPLFFVAESDCVYESSTAVNVNTCDPPPPTTVACADTTAPFTVPSFGVTSTDTVSPASPFPATDRSSVSVNDAVEGVVFTATPFTFHT